MPWNPSQGNYQSILNTTAQTAPISGAYSSAIFNVQNFTSYSFQLTAYCASQGTAGAPMVSEVLLTWFADPLGTIPIWQERWWGWLGNSSANASPMLGAGAIRGPYMQVKVQNVSATAAITISQVSLFGNGLPYVGESDWRQNVPGGITGSGFAQTSPGSSFGDDNILFDVVGLVPAVGVTWQPLPLSAGPIYLRFSTSLAMAQSSSFAHAAALVNGIMASGVGAPGLLINGFSAASTEYEITCIAPHAPCYLIINAANPAGTIYCNIISSKVAK